MFVNVFSGRYLLSHRTFCYQTWYGYAARDKVPECHAENFVHYLECEGHSEGLYNQNITIFNTSSKLLARLQRNLI